MTKCEALFSADHFLISVSTSIGTKKGRICVNVALFTAAPQLFRGEGQLRNISIRAKDQSNETVKHQKKLGT